MSKGERVALYVFVGLIVLYFVQKSIANAQQLALAASGQSSFSVGYGDDGISLSGTF